MNPITDHIESNGIIDRLRWWTLRWLLTFTTEIGMLMHRLTDQVQVKLDAEQEGRHE